MRMMMEHTEKQGRMMEELIQKLDGRPVGRLPWVLCCGQYDSMRERDRLELPSKIGEIQYILESDVLQ
ncbi:hypothetical protein I7I48_11018 [Histoplasma ohiense]|nr:hypothetical protein I7I48_11018 [Histoplasma ohiense (nom. inval.)]